MKPNYYINTTDMIKIVTYYFLFVSVQIFAKDYDAIIQNYKTKINVAIENSNNYTVDVDATRYKPKSNDITEFGEFNYIVIGAGTTGAVVANGLSEQTHKKVLVLEAGKGSDISTDVPLLVYQAQLSDFNWGFHSTPQKNGCLGMKNQACPCPRGRGVGGTSLINGMIYSRANPKDFDRLARDVRNSAWSYSNVLRYFKKGENFTHTNPAAPYAPCYHGKKGYLNVENLNIDNPRSEAFVRAHLELGFKKTDYNSLNELGVSLIQSTIKGGKRADTGTTFILPIKNRKNLMVSMESYVVKIEIHPKTKIAKSVLFSRHGTLYRAKAKNEIILSAGAFQSPQILQLSGVGRKMDLSKFNIPVISELDVGRNLKDQNSIFLSITHNTTDPDIDLNSALKDFVHGRGILTTSNFEGVSFYDSKHKNYPDIELFLIPFAKSPIPNLNNKVVNYTDATLKDLSAGNAKTFSILATDLDPKSLGSVTLKSNSPFDYPLVDPNVLSNPADLEMLYKIIQFTRKIVKTEAFKKINATLLVPKLKACEKYKLDSKGYWYCNFRQLNHPSYHPLGTCAMGKDPKKGAVVDSKLRVFGVKKLRVADASVFPFNLRSHLVANCVLVGQIVSDFIKKVNF
ncbi:unnamed protein product [Brassicogethes aeneus]|uniref:Glucose-methanol-choline oxidoreductase N-terminal domain-containing protein n=1 Tax=Brassicogethes aeneus TaxID=1431903 RepID=A0A9P0AQ52_BRAAE|nr:unnamed protein product [Brassicogethes aeneus]